MVNTLRILLIFFSLVIVSFSNPISQDYEKPSGNSEVIKDIKLYSSYEYNATNKFGSSNATNSDDLELSNEKIEINKNPRTRVVVSEDPLLEFRTATVVGLTIVESSESVSHENEISIIIANSRTVIRLFGDRFTKNTILRFVTEPALRGTDCDDHESTKSFELYDDGITAQSAIAEFQLSPLGDGESQYYICVRENDTDMPWVHQGTEKWLTLKSYQAWLPRWAYYVLLIVLLIFSGLFSGLNLGLMAIDKTELKIIGNTGSKQEKRYAKMIQPLRDHGNFLLCSLLLGNVMVNSTLTILLDGITSGLIAVIGSTLGIVIFGEIIPQAFCSRYGLAVGAKTIWVTKITMAITSPLSYPVSWILDKILGKEIGNVYNRDRLKELIKVTQNDLQKYEVNVIEGVLKLKQCTCADVMTKIDDAYMLPVDAVLDFDTVTEIMQSGYSRIPIYERNRGNVVSILYTKDLAYVDPDDQMPLKTICEFYGNQCNFVEDTKPLDDMFREFKEGSKGHLACVQRYHASDNSDPYYEIIGIITLEDVIEELIQAEINDETDVLANNRSRRRSNGQVNPMPGIFNSNPEGMHVSPQLTLAAFQYLSTTIDAFGRDQISKNILERLLKQNVFIRIKLKLRDDNIIDPSTLIYERGVAADYFVLILEGRVQAVMGKENLIFESGPFTYFGTQSLNQNVGLGESPSTPLQSRKSTVVVASQNNLESILLHGGLFIPDYTVRAVTDVTYLKIPRSIYVAAKQATLLETTFYQADLNANSKAGADFDAQMDSMKHGADEGSNSPDKRSVESITTETDSEKDTEGSTNRKQGGVILSPSLLISPPERDDTQHYPRLTSSGYSETKNSKTYAAMKQNGLGNNNNNRRHESKSTDSENDEPENSKKL